jgi:hypothetical protein
LPAAWAAHQTPRAGAELVDGERGIGSERHRRISADGADAIGPDQPDSGLAHDARQIVLQRGAGRAGIGEAASQDRRDFYAALAAGRECGDRVLAVQQDVGVVDLAGDRVEGLVGFVAHDLAAPRIDRQDLASKAVLAQEALRPRRGLLLVGRGADQGDAPRFEEGLKQGVKKLVHPASILRSTETRRRP